jgi:hypothetical protein
MSVKNLQRKLNRSVQGDVNYGTRQMLERIAKAQQILAWWKDGAARIPACHMPVLEAEATINVMDQRQQENEARWRAQRRRWRNKRGAYAPSLLRHARQDGWTQLMDYSR